jgi:hypothetical protein
MTHILPFGMTHILPFGMTHILSFGMTHILPFGMTHILSFGMTYMLPKQVRKLTGFCRFDERLKHFSEHPQPTSLTRDLLGSSI